MQSEAAMILRNAILHQYVVANLPTDAVAVVVLGVHAADRDEVAVLEKNAASVVAVEVVVVLAIAVECEVLDLDVGNELAAEDGKKRRDGRVAKPPEIFAQWPVDVEAI